MNQTIYFQKQVWAKLGDEPEKSKLINELLKEHYGLSSKPFLYKSKEEIVVSGVKKLPNIPGVSRGFCPHGSAKGLCKIESCNKRFK